ncbi:conserved hypothetical protein [Roseibium sp. TrichSKD4]|uniref:aspartate/glutamate racemase family protein n=1 Tax=Roseibium sp. TrichSKD4 TaxID=744980 RepID=UPI0001E564E3|nr:aspartate/glutamate racemase family protein [Roseibium sp. TrichSKD4]EFO34194.1 conserved hypothetical protein [Roseibium sp. TrichSKD4]
MRASSNRADKAKLGILMLDTQFPRILGDVGNPDTWPFPVTYKIVHGASPDRAIKQDPRKLIEPFIEAGQELVEAGCKGIATTCGFLTLLQDDLARALAVPVATSALQQILMIQAILPPDKRVGVITISKASLTPAHFQAVGVAAPEAVPVVGTEGGREFSAAILENRDTLDVDASRLDLLDAASKLVTRYPDVGAILLECTNMPPYANDIRNATGLPVYSIYTHLCWFHAGL